MKPLSIAPVVLSNLLHTLPGLAADGPCTSISDVKITFFGWDDNGPSAGPATAFGCPGGHGTTAGGTSQQEYGSGVES